jgi:putative ABC transport system permease protein
MIKNYLKIAFRNLWKNKVYSSINIIGLSIGLAAGILLFLWIQDELSFNKFHPKAENIYRVAAQFNNNGKTDVWPSAPAPIQVFGMKEVPEFENTCKISENYGESIYQYKDKSILQKSSAFVDDSFFEMFNFPIVKGNQKKPFSGTRSMVLTEKVANNIFGTENPVGKIIRVDNTHNYEVSAIIKDMPTNSSIRYEVLFPMAIVKEEFRGNGDWKTIDEDWGNFNFEIYFQLKNAANANTAAQKITKIHRKAQKHDNIQHMNYLLQPLTNIHLYKADGTAEGYLIVKIMIIIALIILLIACINYVNLATARATNRAKEVSMRKIIGADKRQLFGQFMSESIIVFVISLVFAILFIWLLIPTYNEVANKSLVFNPFNKNVLMIIGATLLATISLAGIYPAILLSSFKPLGIIKSAGNSTTGTNAFFRKGLVVLQFSFSIILIISTLIIGSQMDFIRKKNLGYQKDNVLTFGMREIYKNYETVKNNLLKQTGIEGITASGGDLLNNGSSTGDADWDGKDPNFAFMVNQMSVDNNFLKTMKIPLALGTDLTGTPADSNYYIFNETAIAQMGMKNPIGKRFKFHEREGRIIGVVKDFHFQNMHKKIAPMILFYSPWKWKMYVKIQQGKEQKVIAAVEREWKKYNPMYPFDYSFLESDFDKMYKTDQTVGKLFNIFAGLAILISCLGLFGLATYTAQTKTKDIGIRKVLGATVSNIVVMLSKGFVKLVVIATLIAFPIGWFAMNKFLENYQYRVDIGWKTFAIAGVLSLLIALLTISFQAVKAALMNPVKSLKVE